MMDKLCILYFGTGCFVTFVLQFGLHNIYFFPLTNNCFWYIAPYFVAVRDSAIQKMRRTHRRKTLLPHRLISSSIFLSKTRSAF